MDTVNVKNFILDAEQYQETEAASAKKKNKVQIKFETLFVSGPDFAIKRSTSRTAQILCCMPSVHQFYIKDEKSGAISKLTEKNLQSFLKGLDRFDVKDPNSQATPFWLDFIPNDKYFRGDLFDLSSDEEWQDLLATGYTIMEGGKDTPENTIRKMEAVMGEKFLRKLFNGFSEEDKHNFRISVGMRPCYYGDHRSMPCYNPATSRKISGFVGSFTGVTSRGYRISRMHSFINDDVPVGEFLDVNDVQYLVERYFDSQATRMPDMKSLLYREYRGNVIKRNLNVRRAIDHIFDSGIEQGYADELDTFCSCWADYLDAQMEVYGKYVNKYPENLASDEHRLNYVAEKRREMVKQEKFAAAAEEMKKYRYENDKFMILSPETPVDIVEEGRLMSNCLAGYADRVANGDCKIFFLREKDKPDNAYVDIQVYHDGSLGQVLARFNRRPSYEAERFVNEWHRKFFAA